MTFTYTGDPRNNQRDGIRFLTGDTNAGQPLLHDEEIEYIQEQWEQYENSPYMLAAQAAEAIAGKFAREISFTSDGQSFSGDQLQEKYLKLAERLRTRANGTHPGELYVSGMETGVGSPAFGTRMHDHPEAGQQDYGDYNDRLDHLDPYSPLWGEFTR